MIQQPSLHLLSVALRRSEVAGSNGSCVHAGSGLRPPAQAGGSPVLQRPSRNGLKAELASNLKNCASNTDLAQFAAAAARAQHGPSPLGPPLRGDEPGTKADDDRVSGLQMPTNVEPLGLTPQCDSQACACGK